MNLNIIGYSIYLLITIFIIVRVGKICYSNGNIFVSELIPNHAALCQKINQVLLLGYYLLNIGFALMILQISEYKDDYQTLIEALSYKIGGFSIYLGIMLFLNLYFFFRGKRKASENQNTERIVFNA